MREEVHTNKDLKADLKSKFTDTLNSFNSSGEISYRAYSELFDLADILFEDVYEVGKSEGRLEQEH